MAEVTDSILDSTKKKLGLGADYDVFDADIIDYINTALANLQQLGIGPEAGFEIEDATATWAAFLGQNASPVFNPVRTFVAHKTRLAWDPPSTSFHLTAFENQIKEQEFRLLIARDEYVYQAGLIVTPDLPVIPEEPVEEAPIPAQPTGPIMADVDGGGADLH